MNLSDVEQIIGYCRERLWLVADGQHEIGNLCIVMSQLVEAVDILRSELQRQAEARAESSPAAVSAPPGWFGNR